MAPVSLTAGRRVAAPQTEDATRRLIPRELRDLEQGLAPGPYGIREPTPELPAVPLDSIGVVIVPAAVWAEDGFRVGYGGGYYDRFLPQLPHARRIGLGLELQVVPEVPHGPHDEPVEVLVTEAGVRRFARRET